MSKSMMDEMESSKDKEENMGKNRKGKGKGKKRKHMSRIWREMKAQTSGLMCRIASFSEVWCEVDDLYTTYYKIIHMYGPT